MMPATLVPWPTVSVVPFALPRLIASPLVVLEVLGEQVLARRRVDGVLELRVLVVHAGVDDGDAHALALWSAPQLVQQDALEGPGAALVRLGGEAALAGSSAAAARRGDGDGQGGGQDGGRRRSGQPRSRCAAAARSTVPYAPACDVRVRHAARGSCVSLRHAHRPHEPCGWRALPVDRRGPVGRNADQSAGTRSGFDLLVAEPLSAPSGLLLLRRRSDLLFSSVPMSESSRSLSPLDCMA